MASKWLWGHSLSSQGLGPQVWSNPKLDKFHVEKFASWDATGTFCSSFDQWKVFSSHPYCKELFLSARILDSFQPLNKALSTVRQSLWASAHSVAIMWYFSHLLSSIVLWIMSLLLSLTHNYSRTRDIDDQGFFLPSRILDGASNLVFSVWHFQQTIGQSVTKGWSMNEV